MSELIIDDRDLARWIIFNRPAELNTLKLDDLHAARAAVTEAAAAGRTIVFSGAGERAFSAGMNLDLFAGLVADPSRTRTEIGAVRELIDAVRRAETVTIAAINGHCLGGAFELALACDFRFARAGVLLGLPEMKLGLPCILDSALLAQYVGMGLAKEMMLTGRMYPAERLAAYGAVSVLDDAEALDDAVQELVEEFDGVSRVGIASQKRLFEAWQNQTLDAFNDTSLDEIVRVFHDDDTRERISAYTDALRARSRSR